MPDRIEEAAVLVRGGKIEAVVPIADLSDSYERHDFGEFVVMAGLVDPHVHINEPGRTDWEGFLTATRAAAAGGTTTVVDMPLNSLPVTTSVEALDRKLDAAAGRLHVDCGFYGGLIPGSVHHLVELIDHGVFGIKTFLIESGIDEFPATDRSTLERAVSVIAYSSIPLLAHAEIRGADDAPQHEIRADRDTKTYPDYLSTRPASWETRAISLLAGLSERYGCPIHIVHLAAAEALDILHGARVRGAPLTVETCPHYLYFDAESIEPGQVLLKCAPPIRSRANNDRLFAALLDNQIDFVASDHSPTIPAAKALDRGNFAEAWGGIASLQLRLPVMWTMARSAGAGLNDLARWLAERPAAFLGLEGRKGSIRPGSDADFVVWSPEADFVVTPVMLHDRHKLTPYEGRHLFGSVKATYLRGVAVYDDGRFCDPLGRPLFRD